MTKSIFQKPILVCLTFLLTFSLLFAQDRSVTGKVISVDGLAAVGVSVSVVGSSNKAITDSKGAFTLLIPQGDFEVQVDPAPNNPSGREVFLVMNTDGIVSLGSLYLGQKNPVPGLSDFEGTSKYVADRGGNAPKLLVIGQGNVPQSGYISTPTTPTEVTPVSPTDDVAIDQVSPTTNEVVQQSAVPSDDSKQLDEVVVVGYGTVKKSDATGAIGALGDKDFNKGINVSPETLLQGKMSGIQVTSSSGEPGAAISMKIRGTNSVRASNNPLIVVDGFPLDGSNVSDGSNDGGGGIGSSTPRNPLNFLNPSDIERIDVLKDASATAIYGSRGANGVVLITTKKGSASKPLKVNLITELSVSGTQKRLDLLGRKDFLDLGYKAQLEKTPTLTRNAYDLANDFGSNTDWQKQIFRTGITQNYALSFEGGAKLSNFRFSAGYFNQTGIVRGSELEKFSGQLNASQKFLDEILEIGVLLNGSVINDKYAPISNNSGYEGDLLIAAIQANPTRPVYELSRPYDKITASPSLGGLYFQEGATFRNPVAMLNYIDDRNTTSRILGNLYLQAKVTKWLTYKVQVGMDYSTSVRKNHIDYFLDLQNIARGYSSNAAKSNNDPSGVTTNGGFASIKTRSLQTLLMDHTLAFNHKIGNDVDFTFLLGYSYQSFSNIYSQVTGKNFQNNQIRFYNSMEGAKASEVTTESDNTLNELQSFFGRLNVGYKNFVQLTATLRADGSSKFGTNNKYGVFPAFALAWRISEHSFVPKVFDELKLRLGWGISGNQEFPGRIARGSYTISSNGARTYTSTPNPNIKWESTMGINAGLDFALLKNRIYGSFEYFYKNTTDLIFKNPAPQPAVAPTIWQNLDAELINAGIEFNVNAVVLDGEFRWTTGANFTYQENKITNYKQFKNTGAINGQGLSGAFAERIANDQPINVFYMFESTNQYDSKGSLLVYGSDGSKVTTSDAKAEKRYLASPNPNFLFGWTNTLEYKNFDLNILFSGVAGNKVYNNLATAIFNRSTLAAGRNVTSAVANSSENAVDPVAVSSKYLEDGSFLRLTNVTLGYSLPIKSQKYVKSVRFYLTGQNLFVITAYKGFDPEVNVDKSIDDIPSFGIDYSSYPRAITGTLGINVVF